MKLKAYIKEEVIRMANEDAIRERQGVPARPVQFGVISRNQAREFALSHKGESLPVIRIEPGSRPDEDIVYIRLGKQSVGFLRKFLNLFQMAPVSI